MNLKLKNRKIFDSDYYDKSYFTKKGCKGWYDEHAFKLTQIFHKNWAEFVIYNLKINPKQDITFSFEALTLSFPPVSAGQFHFK